MFQEHSGGISAVFFKGFHEAPAGVFVNGGVLIELLSLCLVHQAYGRDKLDVDLDALTGMVHLLVRLGDVLWVGRFHGGKALFFQEAVKAGDGAIVTTLDELDPEDDEAGIGITPAHIGDEFDLLRGMLVRVVVWSPGSITQGLNRAVKAIFPAVDVLPVSLVFDGSVGDAILLSIPDKG